MSKTRSLTAEQLQHVRKNRERGAKALAQELSVPRRLVEDALEAAEATTATATGVWAKLALAALLSLVLWQVGSFAYRGAETHDELHFDDTGGLRNNAAIRVLHDRYESSTREGDSARDRLRAFMRAVPPTAEAIYAFNLYRMVTYWSFALTYLDHPLEGTDPVTHQEISTRAALPGWHVANNHIHLLNGLLAFWVAWLTLTAPAFKSRPFAHPLLLAFVAALIFTLHPLQVQSVAYLVQRTEALCATFYLLAIGLFATARRRALSERRGSAPWMTGVVLGGAGGVLFLLAAVAMKSDALDIGGLVTATKLIAVATGAALVALVKTGRDEPGHALCVVGTYLAFALGLQTKELAATIPFTLFVWDLLFVPSRELASAATPAPAALRLPGKPWLAQAVSAGFVERARYLGPWAAIVIGVVLVAVVFGGANIASMLMAEGVEEGGAGRGAQISAVQYLVTQANVLCTYVRLFVLPTRLHLDHDYPIAAGLSGATLLALVSGALVLGAAGLAAWRGARARVAAFAVLMGLLVLAPTSSVIVLPDVIYEHRFYIPLFGAALLVAVLLDRGARRLPAHQHAPALLAAGVVLAIPLLLITRVRNDVWSTEASLWEDVTEKSPGKARGWTNLGLAYMNRGEWHVELTDGRVFEGLPVEMANGGTLIFPTTIPGQPPLYVPPGGVRGKRKTPIGKDGPGLDKALDAFAHAFAIDPTYTKALNNAAIVWITKGKVEDYAFDATRQLGAQAEQAGDAALVLRCKADYDRHQAERDRCYREAERSYVLLLQVRPDDALAWSNFSGFYSTCMHDFVKALECMEKALSLGAPETGWVTRGDLNAMLGHQRYWARKDAGEATVADDGVRARWVEARRCYQQYLLHPLARGVMLSTARGRLELMERILAGATEPPRNDVLPPPPAPSAPPAAPGQPTPPGPRQR